MSVAKIYNSGTGQWEPAIIGKEGPVGEPGVVQSTTEPADTSVLWLDTDDTAEPLAIPAGGAAGQILQKSTSGDYDTAWSNPPSPNYITNGGFDVWQRGTSFTATGYSADRWYTNATGTTTVSRNTDYPVGIGVQYSCDWTTGASSSFGQFYQAFETAEVVPMRNKQFTLSYYVKSAGSMAGNIVTQLKYSTSTDALISQSTDVTGSGDTSFAASTVTDWTRKKVTFTVPSDAVGLRIAVVPSATQASGVSCRIAGVQLEAGSVATPFKRNAPSLQGELAACQRYYYLHTEGSLKSISVGTMYNATTLLSSISFPVAMRIPPSAEITSATAAYRFIGDNVVTTFDSFDFDRASNMVGRLSSISISSVQGRTGVIETNAGSTARVAFRAEL